MPGMPTAASITIYDSKMFDIRRNVEINIAWDDAYQIRFDLGERGGKRIVDKNITSYPFTLVRHKMEIS